MPCRDSDAPDMGTNLPDMGSEPFESSPDAAQPGIDQAGSPQTDMEGPTAADIAMDAQPRRALRWFSPGEQRAPGHGARSAAART